MDVAEKEMLEDIFSNLIKSELQTDDFDELLFFDPINNKLVVLTVYQHCDIIVDADYGNYSEVFNMGEICKKAVENMYQFVGYV